MIYPSADVLENWGSKYSLVVLTAKRAKQIKSGAPPLIPTTSRNPITIALEEIAAGKVLCQVADHDILPKTSQETEVAQLLAIPTAPIDEEEAGAEAADLSEDVELITEDEELEEEDDVEKVDEEEAVSGLLDDVEEDEDEEPLAIDDDEAETEPVAEELDILAAPEEPKPKAKRGRKKKVETEALVTDESDSTDSDVEDSDD